MSHRTNQIAYRYRSFLRWQTAASLAAALALQGCGGGGGGGSPPAGTNVPPTVSVTAPTGGAAFSTRDVITFRATASDAEDGDVSARVQWTSSVAGVLNTGATFSTALATGTHLVTAKVADSDGLEQSTSVTIVVSQAPLANTAPTVSVTAPSNGARFAPSNSITFRATAADAQDGNLSGAVQWRSSLAGALGSGETLTTNLAAGLHTVTAAVTDAGGLAASAAVSVIVSGPPIANAGPDRSAIVGTAVTLSGAASSDIGGSITAYQWSQTAGPSVPLSQPSAVNTSFTAPQVTTSTVLSFSLRVTDDQGQASTDTVNVTVNLDPSTPTVLTFEDITSSAGVESSDPFGGHGSMFGDANGDGLPDLYVTVNQGGVNIADLFYLNLGGGEFREEGFARGIDNIDTGSHGGVWADFDNDGDLDLFNGSFDQNRIYRNYGSGTFTDATSAAGLPARAWSTRASIALDLEGDGDLDVFAVNGYLGNDDPSDERNEIYRNDGNFQFTPIDTGALAEAIAGQGATSVDFDNDGDVDVFAANRTGPVAVLRNDGGGSFAELDADALGLEHDGRDGLTFADVNGDGFHDALLSQTLYLHDGVSRYVWQQTFDSSAYHYMGGFADLDNDGDFDLVFPGADHVYVNDGAGEFTASSTFTIGAIDDPRSVSFADIDQDGDLDFFYGQKWASNRLIESRLVSANHWLKIDLRGAGGQRAPYGARVHVYEAGALGDSSRRITWSELRSQDGYLSQSDSVLHVGVGARERVDVRAEFLGGATVDLPNVATNAWLEISRP